MSIRKFLKNKWILVIGGIVLLMAMASCKKLVEVEPPANSISEASVYSSDATAIAVMTGIYINLGLSNQNFATGNTSVAFRTGLSADELTLFSGVSNASQKAYYTNTLAANIGGAELWNNMYPYIFKCNSAIEGVSNSTQVSAAVRNQVLGEAKFMRAFIYFYLVNLYGDVPLSLTTDYTKNNFLPRSRKDEVYSQIISDLTSAQALLSKNYLDGSLLKQTVDRVRPTSWAATALLARIYLFIGDFAKAEEQSTAIVNNTSLFNLVALDKSFQLNNQEAIWQLQPVNTGQNTSEAPLYILPATGPSTSFPVYLSNILINNFEPGDLRLTNWIANIKIGTTTYYYSYKYKSSQLNAPVTEYLMVLRLAEQYLIRAEARVQQNNISGGQTDLNVLRKRAGLSNTIASDKSSLMNAILHERQVELFNEWGHRWLDLKRLEKVDSTMQVVTPLKSPGTNWNSYQQLFPIPLSDIQKDPYIIQNPSY